MRATTIEGQNALAPRVSRSKCVLCIPNILSGSPSECWLHTCDACVITTWRLELRAPLVACIINNNNINNNIEDITWPQIPLRVFLNTKRDISYLQAAM